MRFLYLILLGLAVGYFVTGLWAFKMSPKKCEAMFLAHSSSRHQNEKIVDRVNISDILTTNNVFGALVETKNRIKRKKVPVKLAKGSTLKGYNLVGIVTGNNPMALLKKGNESVQVVTFDLPLENDWYLSRVENDKVVLMNKRTGERVSFKLEVLKKDYNNSLNKPESGGLEKIKISKKEALEQAKDMNRLLTKIRLVPAFEKGKAIGYKVAWVARGSIFDKLGLKPGDVVVSINGESVQNIKGLLRMYSSIGEMDSVVVEVLRNGRLNTLVIDLE
ncbi:general secretion pathway protein C [Thermosulfidibacter takaii ABI70S6]|uniref:General secretion pathway protein C n=1 Tax=Thermosulfidibacter takaii (strain DSM 17441 / JCM 13301 / NBRC 103674 / ABI70S6) TaxID=1298851 RepID=A0A0S3QVR6_THET7|nr:PDZ domain-containing protein [Thermosulfidibacter takaii]BAT72417.1 general secretion pathway protein C [Thermosulfidibacter takaii ABI70S6]